MKSYYVFLGPSGPPGVPGSRGMFMFRRILIEILFKKVWCFLLNLYYLCKINVLSIDLNTFLASYYLCD